MSPQVLEGTSCFQTCLPGVCTVFREDASSLRNRPSALSLTGWQSFSCSKTREQGLACWCLQGLLRSVQMLALWTSAFRPEGADLPGGLAHTQVSYVTWLHSNAVEMVSPFC